MRTIQDGSDKLVSETLATAGQPPLVPKVLDADPVRLTEGDFWYRADIGELRFFCPCCAAAHALGATCAP